MSEFCQAAELLVDRGQAIPRQATPPWCFQTGHLCLMCQQPLQHILLWLTLLQLRQAGESGDISLFAVQVCDASAH